MSNRTRRSERKINNVDTKKIKIISIGIGIFIFLMIFISIIFALINMNNNKIISGVSIAGINVSGLSKEEAKSKLEPIYNEKINNIIKLKYNEYETEISPESMELKYEVDNAIEEAFLVGREKNIFVNNYEILFTLIGKKSIDVNMNINEESTMKQLEDIGSKLPGVVIEPGYYQDGETLIITKGKEGIKIDSSKLLEQIKNYLRNVNEKNNNLEIPVSNKIPEPIDIDKIHQEVYKEAKDAYYNKDPFEIVPEVNGVDFDVDAAKELLKEDKEEYEIKLTIIKPKVTIEQFGSELFPNRLSVFTTRYDASNRDRTTNLRIATNKINGRILMPGETFSYNSTLGERTIANGYKEAKIYVKGEVVDGLGGGICQISSTLYNAVVMANLEIVERSNHQFVTSYLPAGKDATVAYGSIDFKFKNTRKYPIKIVATIQNGIATTSIYGIKEEKEYNITLETKTVNTIPFDVKYIDDSSVSGEVVKQKGTNGIQTVTYKVMSLNGSVVSRNVLSRDTYNAMQRIIIRGNAENSEPVNNEAETVPVQSEPVEQEKPAEPTSETPPPSEPVNIEEQQQHTDPEQPVNPQPTPSGDEGNNGTENNNQNNVTQPSQNE